jgi:predicted permease
MRARIRQVWAKLTGLMRGRRAEHELSRELAAHVALLEDEGRRRGLSAEDARRAARIALGGIEQTKELHRDARAFVWLEDAWRDAGYALRLLLRNRAIAMTAILSLAISIGANTAAFTVANALLFRAPAGVTAPDRLVDIGIGRPDGGFNPSSYAVYLRLRETATTLDALYARPMFPSALSFNAGPDRPIEQVHGQSVTANYFDVLGVRPTIGRVFTATDSARPEGQSVAVISAALWRSRFASDPAIAGKEIRLNERPVTIVGVAPDGFQGIGIVSADLWQPMSAANDAMFANREPALDGGWLLMGARLKPGVTVEQAAAEIDAIGQALDRQYSKEPGSARTLRLLSASVVPGNRTIIAGFMIVIMAMALLILLVACTNLSGVLLARAAARRREMAVRISIGAGRARVVRQLLIETVLLFVLGGALGTLLARMMTTLFASALPSLPFPVAVSLPLDVRVLAFTGGLSLLAALIFGLAPALQASKIDSASALKEDAQGPSRRSRLRRLFVVAQVACSIVLVVTAGLFVRALQHAGSANQGFDTRGIELTSINLQMGRYTDGTATAFWRDLLVRAKQVPGIERAVLARVVPGGFESIRFGIGVPDAAPLPGGEDFHPDGNIVSPGYFATMRIPLAGRDFSDADQRATEPVVIIGEAVAKRYWPNQQAIGQYMTEGPEPNPKRLRVVGVARDIVSSSLIDGLAQSHIYLPLSQQPYTPILTSTMTLIVKTTGTRPVADDVRAVIASIDPRLPVLMTETIENSIALGQAPQRIVASIAGSLGIVGLILAAIGVYGITAFAVTSRTRELGIRIALGARRSQIMRMVLRQGIVSVTVGMIAGLGVAAPIAQVLSVFMFGLPPLDPVTFGGAAVLFFATALAACYGPARRATRVDPLVTLRHE